MLPILANRYYTHRQYSENQHQQPAAFPYSHSSDICTINKKRSGNNKNKPRYS